MAPERDRLRVGSVPYRVGRPLDAGLAAEPGVELVLDVPARLVEGLRAGRIDVALVSSIELFRRPGYSYLDGIAVAGNGGVSSVQCFLRAPLDRARTLALDPASRAAAALVAVELAERAPHVELVAVEPGADPRDADADGWLRIGDGALRETVAEAGAERFNPSGSWCERTGQAFVFAPWIARPGVDLAPWLGAFRRAWAHGREHLDQIARDTARELELPADAVRRYFFEEIDYEPGARQTPALLAFRDAAAAVGACDGGAEPTPVPVGGARVS